MMMETGSHRRTDEVDWTCCIDTVAGADDDEYPHAVVSRIKEGTRKRLYEYREDELDREMDKMYKRDYWEDPAYASLLEVAGLGLARADAVICSSQRTLRATRAMLAEWRQEQELRSSRGCKDNVSESEPELEPAARQGRFFLCFWRSIIVDKLAALLHYFLG